MNRSQLWGAAILAVFSSSASLARSIPKDIPVPTVQAVAPASSSVHDWNGQRFDVPSNLLRRPGVMINGLGPQAAQFE